MTTTMIPEAFPGEPPVTSALVREHKLNELEYTTIRSILGDRTPTLTELGIFSALWSEHCSYKHTKPVLGTFPTTGVLWSVLLVGVVVIVGALTFFPALSLGPIVEQLLQNAGEVR